MQGIKTVGEPNQRSGIMFALLSYSIVTHTADDNFNHGENTWLATANHAALLHYHVYRYVRCTIMIQQYIESSSSQELRVLPLSLCLICCEL